MIRAALFAVAVSLAWWSASGDALEAFTLAATGVACALVAWLAAREVRRA